MKFLLFGTQEIIIIALVIILLFGGKKIPELMRGLGRGVRSFKEGMNGEEPADKSSDSAASSDKASDTSSDKK